MNYIKQFFIGYGELLKRSSIKIFFLIKVILFLSFVFLLSIAIVYPLWYLAEMSTNKYSMFVIIAALTSLLAFILFKIWQYIHYNSIKDLYIKIFLPQIKRVVKVASYIIMVILLVIFFNINWLLGFSVLIALLIIIGFFKFVYKR